VLDSSAHAYRILAILETGDIMGSPKGYRCDNPKNLFYTNNPDGRCLNVSLYKKDFYEMTKDGEYGLFCPACASLMAGDGWDGYMEQEGAGLGDDPSLFNFGVLSERIDPKKQEPDIEPLGPEDDGRLESTVFTYILDYLFHEKYPQSATPAKDEDLVNEPERPRGSTAEDFNFILGQEPQPATSEAIAVMQLFSFMPKYTLTDIQKRNIRLALKRAKVPRK
jgi:hypothetical protein